MEANNRTIGLERGVSIAGMCASRRIFSGLHPCCFCLYSLMKLGHSPCLPSIIVIYVSIQQQLHSGALVHSGRRNPSHWQPTANDKGASRADHGFGLTVQPGIDTRQRLGRCLAGWCMPCRFGNFGGGESSWRLKIDRQSPGKAADGRSCSSAPPPAFLLDPVLESPLSCSIFFIISPALLAQQC